MSPRRRTTAALLAGACAAALLTAAAPATTVFGEDSGVVRVAGGVETEVRYVPTSAQGGAVIRVELHRDSFFDGGAPGDRNDAVPGQPVLLSYSPYNSIGAPAGTGVEGNDNVAAFVDDGIAAASADVLGTRGSTGCWDYGGADEQQSGVDVVNFLSGLTPDVDGNFLDWASGSVGMTGVSYDGTTANMVAAAGDRAPGLKAVVPIAAISRWYGYAYSPGGVRFFGNSEVPTDEGFDSPLAFDHGFSDTVHPDNAVDGAVAHAGECGATEHTLQAYSRTPDYGDFWVERDYARATADQWTAATLIVHGWNDENVKADEAIRLHEHLATLDDPATSTVEGPSDLRLWMMQAAHADGSGDGYQALLRDFWLAHLLDDASAADRLATDHPRVRSGAGVSSSLPRGSVVTTDVAWPLTGTNEHTFFLNRTYEQDLDGVTVPGPGTGEVGELAYDNRFDGPLDGRGGAYGPTSSWVDSALATEELSRNDPWSNEGARGDGLGGQGYYALAFSTGTLERDVRIAGRAVLDGVFQIGFGAGIPNATLTPVLVDVAPDGTMATIQRGFLDVGYRDGLEGSSPATGTITAAVEFLPNDHVVAAGHRIGLLLQSSNAVWAVPGTPAGLDTVFLGPVDGLSDAGTVLRLPLVDAAAPIFTDAPGR